MPLLHACKHFGILPHEMLLIGDSLNDAEAARAAGCHVFCVPYGYNEGRDVRELDCDAIVTVCIRCYKIDSEIVMIRKKPESRNTRSRPALAPCLASLACLAFTRRVFLPFLFLWSQIMTETEFNGLARKVTTAFRWCWKLSPISIRRCRFISSSPTGLIPIYWNRCRAASASGAIPSSACRPVTRIEARGNRVSVINSASDRQEIEAGDPLAFRRVLSCRASRLRRTPVCRVSAAAWWAISATTRCAISRKSWRVMPGPIRSIRRISCCCCPKNWRWSTTCPASSI